MKIEDPSALIQRQLDAYNTKNVEAWLSTYAPDAEQYNLHGERIAQGHEELKARILARFEEPDLHARLLSRTALGNVVVDAEEITRTFPEGRGTIEMLCIYEVINGCIAKASFALGRRQLQGRPESAAQPLAPLSSNVMSHEPVTEDQGA